MRITVRFTGGSVEEFDTNSLTTESALGRANALTDLRVVIADGLWVEASWYRVSQGTDDDGRIPLAQRSPGCRLHVLSADEVTQVRSIELDGRVQWQRVGPDLCDMALLDDMIDLLHDAEEPSPCVAGKAVWLHDRLKERMPGFTGQADGEQQLCSMLGLTEASLEFLSGLSGSVYPEEDYD